MLIPTTIQKRFGLVPGEVISLPDIIRTLIITLEAADDVDLGASGGGSTTGPGGFSGAGNDVPNPQPPDPWSTEIQPGESGGSSPSSTVEDALASFQGGTQLYWVSAIIINQSGITLAKPRGGLVSLAPGLDGSTASIQLDPITERVVDPFPPPVLSNEPGWDGAAVSVDERELGAPVTYAFDPLPDVPFFTGLTEVDDGRFLRPSDYFAAFEVFGSQAVIWYEGVAVVDPFDWTPGDRFSIVQANGVTQFFVNAEPKWSS